MTLTRAYLRAQGWADADFDKPIITVASPWSTANPCNWHHRELTDLLVEAIELKGGRAFVAGTPIISDGMTQGTAGMRYSLPSRDLIADCIETMHEGYAADAIVALAGCDKSVPAAAMPLARSNAIGLALYGGTAQPGRCAGCVNTSGGAGLDGAVVCEAIGAYGAGLISQRRLGDIEENAFPGVGTCSAMFTANTMSCALEALGLSPPGTASHPAVEKSEPRGPNAKVSAQKRKDVQQAVDMLWGLMASGRTARQILTMEAFENAIAVVYALGGSTNAVLHLLAIARERGHGALHAGKSLCKHPRLDLNTPAFCNLVCVPLPFPSPFPTAL